MKKWEKHFRDILDKTLKPNMYSMEIMMDKPTAIDYLVRIEKGAKSCK